MAGTAEIFQGLDFWAPNINIFRDPRWGRGQETYGEDPFLTARMGVAFVTGMQGDDPKYFRVISTPKHYAVHSGPEPTRHNADVPVSKHDELDTYLPAFRATVTEAKADSVMCAYNSINGQPACANEFLLAGSVSWQVEFPGLRCLRLRCGDRHLPRATNSTRRSRSLGHQSAAGHGQRVRRLHMSRVNDDHDYKPYLDAVKQGYLKESDIDIGGDAAVHGAHEAGHV